MAKQGQISGPPAFFLIIALTLLSVAGAAASWGVLWRAFVWAF